MGQATVAKRGRAGGSMRRVKSASGSVTAVWGKGAVVAALAFIVALVPAVSDATLVGDCSGPLENLGACTKTVTYDSTTNKLTITLENTSPAANGGFLTADAFDLGAPELGDISVIAFTKDAVFTDFALFPAPLPSSGGNIPVPPFTDLDREFVISIGGDWVQEDPFVSPSTGIPVGESATFTLTLSADISESSLFGTNEVIRFRGFEDGGSDKTFTTVTTVPQPGTLILLASALVGIGAWRQKRLLGRRDS
jgi:hypothetical protein